MHIPEVASPIQVFDMPTYVSRESSGVTQSHVEVERTWWVGVSWSVLDVNDMRLEAFQLLNLKNV